MIFYLFTDLDDTLFQTLGKCGPGKSHEDAALFPAAVGRDGKALSFMLPGQQALFSIADQHMRIVPVTARNLDSFQRVNLPFRHGAILNYGATILRWDGEEDDAWGSFISGELEAYGDLLSGAVALIESVIDRERLSSTVRLVADPRSGTAFYALAKNPDRNFLQLEHIRAELERAFHPGLPWRLHHNGNNLAVIPGCLDKARAVAHFIATTIPEFADEYATIGMGDSLEDLGFMNLCDYAVIPAGSQIATHRLGPGSTSSGSPFNRERELS